MKHIFPACALLLVAAISCNKYITYEQFGAVGDGRTDDQAAIIAAHRAANEKGLPVRADNDRTYYIGGGSDVAIIKTDVDWGTARFIIDDVNLEDRNKTVFLVEASEEPYEVSIDGPIHKGQKNLGVTLARKGLVHILNADKKIYYREGLNQDNGWPQQEVLLVDENGDIDASTVPVWEYDHVTKVTVYPSESRSLIIRGGIFTTIANQKESRYEYVKRGIEIRRSNVLIENVTHYVEGEKDQGWPYRYFIGVYFADDVEVRDCIFTGHTTYLTIGAINKPVWMGSYEFNAGNSTNVKLKGCTQTNDIHDKTFWGVYTSNWCKNLSMEDCVLSRFDAHMGVNNVNLKNCEFGYQGVRMVGFGKILLENCICNTSYLIFLRADYGSSWDGDVEIRNCVLKPRGNGFSSTYVIMGNNAHKHDFGYDCKLPRNIFIDGLTIEDGEAGDGYPGPCIFSDFNVDAPANASIKNLTVRSGKPIAPCINPDLFRSMTLN